MDSISYQSSGKHINYYSSNISLIVDRFFLPQLKDSSLNLVETFFLHIANGSNQEDVEEVHDSCPIYAVVYEGMG